MAGEVKTPEEIERVDTRPGYWAIYAQNPLMAGAGEELRVFVPAITLEDAWEELEVARAEEPDSVEDAAHNCVWRRPRKKNKKPRLD